MAPPVDARSWRWDFVHEWLSLPDIVEKVTRTINRETLIRAVI
jgi:hypothetical protein